MAKTPPPPPPLSSLVSDTRTRPLAHTRVTIPTPYRVSAFPRSQPTSFGREGRVFRGPRTDPRPPRPPRRDGEHRVVLQPAVDPHADGEPHHRGAAGPVLPRAAPGVLPVRAGLLLPELDGLEPVQPPVLLPADHRLYEAAPRRQVLPGAGPLRAACVLHTALPSLRRLRARHRRADFGRPRTRVRTAARAPSIGPHFFPPLADWDLACAEVCPGGSWRRRRGHGPRSACSTTLVADSRSWERWISHRPLPALPRVRAQAPSARTSTR